MHLPPLRRFLYRLRFTRPARLPFFHGGVLRGLLSRALDTHELPTGLVPVVCEMGRVAGELGEGYHLGVVLAGADARDGLAERLASGLARVGEGEAG